MQEIIFEGKIEAMSEPRTYKDKQGTQHFEREIVVATDEMYPQRCCINLRDGDAQLPLQIGRKVKCALAFFVSRSEGGRYFNNIRAWRVDF